MERARRAARRGDREAEDAAFVDGMRAEVREGWKDFRERRLLADLYRRAALRRRVADLATTMIGASRLIGWASWLPRQCWPTSRLRAGACGKRLW